MSASGQVTVADSDLISSGGAYPGRPVLIKNASGGADVYLGDSTTTTDGFLLEAGESARIFVGNDDLYGYCETQSTIYWIAG